MNNYCTNCGKKLNSNEIVCTNCNTPIINLPYNYVLKKEKNSKKTIVIIVIGVIIFATFICSLSIKILEDIRIKNHIKSYVKPYLVKNYGDQEYDINYDSNGKCIISGDCKYEPANGCSGTRCKPYEYLDEKNCKSYYYSVSIDGKIRIFTVVNRNNKVYVVEGKNINGNDD